jgi:hypothetical protein
MNVIDVALCEALSDYDFICAVRQLRYRHVLTKVAMRKWLTR